MLGTSNPERSGLRHSHLSTLAVSLPYAAAERKIPLDRFMLFSPMAHFSLLRQPRNFNEIVTSNRNIV